MPSVTIRPSATGDQTNITSQSIAGSNGHWGRLSDELDTTFVQEQSGTYQEDNYNLPDSQVPAGALNITVDVHYRSARTVGTLSARVTAGVRLSSTDVLGTEHVLTTTITEYTDTSIARPGGGSWSVADIDSLQTVLKLRNLGGTARGQCYDIWIVVNYDIAPTGVIASDLTKAVSSLTGEQILAGTMASVLQAAISVLSGLQVYTGTMGASLTAPTSAFSGETIVPSIITSEMQEPISALVGLMHPSGVLGAELTEPVAEFISGQADNIVSELQHLAAAIVAQHINLGSIAATLTETEFDGITVLEFTGLIVSALQSPTSSLTAEQILSGILGVSLTAALMSATGFENVTGVMASVLQAVLFSASARPAASKVRMVSDFRTTVDLISYFNHN